MLSHGKLPYGHVCFVRYVYLGQKGPIPSHTYMCEQDKDLDKGLNPLMHGGNKRSYVLTQRKSF